MAGHEEPQHTGTCGYWQQANALQAKLDEIVRITENSPGCDPVAAVRHLWNNANDMLREMARLREDLATWRGIANDRGDKIEGLRAELRATTGR